MEPLADQTVEIKARCTDPEEMAVIIRKLGAEFKGRQSQVDTFYRVPHGRLKLRRSESEECLIGYRRPDHRGPKHCLVNLYPCRDTGQLDRVLSDALGVRIVVKKERDIYRLGDTKFPLDNVEGLGSFVEIEVLGRRGVDSVDKLRAACEKYLGLLGIRREDLIAESYGDMLLKR